MSQRIRSCTNTTNMDTINCDAYSSRLIRQDSRAPNNAGTVKNKIACLQGYPRNRSVSNTRSNGTGAIALPSTPPNLKSRPGSVRQHNLPSPTRNNNSLVHKEVIADNSALVEVTVRAHTSRRPRTGDSKKNSGVSKTSQEPWGNILKSTKSIDNLSSFGNFDPLRTLHFLAQELQAKLKTTSSNDPNVLQMIADMQHALNRIPAEVVSAIHVQQELNNFAAQKLKKDAKQLKNGAKYPTEDDIEFPEKLVHVDKPTVSHKNCQTITESNDIIMESEMFQKLLEAGTMKLETTCKQLEQNCNRLKNEKKQMEHLLVAEKETVKALRKQIEDMEIEKTEQTNFAFDQLVQERNALQVQVTKLRIQMDNLQGPSIQELKSMAQKLQAQAKESEHKILSLQHKLTLCNLEKDKYVAILSVRNRQISEISKEMNQLQEVINEQLMELQKTPFASSPSSQSTILSNISNMIWPQIQGGDLNNHEDGDHARHTFRELPSGDSVISNFESVTGNTKIKPKE